jgi:hypothetical protein
MIFWTPLEPSPQLLNHPVLSGIIEAITTVGITSAITAVHWNIRSQTLGHMVDQHGPPALQAQRRI